MRMKATFAVFHFVLGIFCVKYRCVFFIQVCWIVWLHPRCEGVGGLLWEDRRFQRSDTSF